MKRVELTEAVLSGWSRLTAAERDRFFLMFLRAALRLEPLALRVWLRKRLKNRPLCAPIDPACYTLGDDVDIALAMRAAREFAPDRDETNGG